MAGNTQSKKTKAHRRDNLIKALDGGKWKTNWELVKEGAGFRYGAVMHSLRKVGYDFEKECIDAPNGIWRYRMTKKPLK